MVDAWETCTRRGNRPLFSGKRNSLAMGQDQPSLSVNKLQLRRHLAMLSPSRSFVLA